MKQIRFSLASKHKMANISSQELLQAILELRDAGYEYSEAMFHPSHSEEKVKTIKLTENVSLVFDNSVYMAGNEKLYLQKKLSENSTVKYFKEIATVSTFGCTPTEYDHVDLLVQLRNFVSNETILRYFSENEFVSTQKCQPNREVLFVDVPIETI